MIPALIVALFAVALVYAPEDDYLNEDPGDSAPRRERAKCMSIDIHFYADEGACK